jgi:hypothetical protein
MRSATLILAMLALFVNPSHAQDERFWRKMITGELNEEAVKEPEIPKWVFTSPSYQFDLNNDGREESIQLVKRDGIDWIDILGHDKTQLFSGKLWALGVNSSVYRLRLIDLSPTVRVIVIFLNEGKTEAKHLEATARLYFLTFENKDFSTFKLTQGPRYWHEYESVREQYWRRLHSFNVKDYNGDGVKDLAVEFNHIQSIWMYQGQGLWKSL